MTTRSYRRWFQFRLSTMLLLMIVPAVWLGWELKFIRERDALRCRVIDSGGFVLQDDIVGYPRPAIPWWRAWLGDEPLSYIRPGDKNLSEDDARRLFPELQLFGEQFGPS